MRNKFKFIIEKTNTGYSGFTQHIPVFTTGKTILDLQEKALEAINLYFEDQKRTINRNSIDFEIDLKQFFEYYKVINAKHLAIRIGMNESLLSQYVNGKRKASRKQVQRIVDGLHEIGKELIELNIV